MTAGAPPAHDLIVVRYGEIFLKGGNRSAFVDALRRRLRRATEGTGWALSYVHGRFLLRPEDPVAATPAARATEQLRRVFGVVSVSPAVETAPTMEALRERAVALAVASVPRGARTFRVRTRRPDKTIPLRSMEVSRDVGAAVNVATGLAVDLSRPDLEVAIELGDVTFVHTERLPGPGGLPVGASGRAALLLSGGIDSPVAGWMAMKRGSPLDAIYFHSFPLIGEAAREKVRDLALELARWGGPVPLHVVPFADAQVAVRDACDPRLYVLLYRRLMFRIAERIARARRALALVTGESVGQVASQTLENLDCIGAVVDMPVLRPLVGMDKVETMDRARAIGTYDISIQPHQDCCSLFVPKHPETRGRRAVLERAEARLDIEALVEQAIEGTEVEEIRA